MENETELPEINKINDLEESNQKKNKYHIFWYSALIIVLFISIGINYQQYNDHAELEDERASLARGYISMEDESYGSQNEIERLKNELYQCQNSLSSIESQLSDCESYLGQCKNNVSDLESRECNNY